MSVESKCSHRARIVGAHEITTTGATEALDLLRALEGNERFRRDSRLGAILHCGKISFREVSPTDSLHILIDGPHVSAHVDEVSPLVIRPDGSVRYAWGRVFAHNVTVIAADLARRLRGRPRDHRCQLHCEAVWVDDEGDIQAGPDPEA